MGAAAVGIVFSGWVRLASAGVIELLVTGNTPPFGLVGGYM